MSQVDLYTPVRSHPGKRPLEQQPTISNPLLKKAREATTLKKADPKEEPFVPSKPVLPPPKCVALIAIDKLLKVEQLGEKFVSLNRVRLDNLELQLQKLSIAEAAKIQEEAARVEEGDFWTFLKDIASVITAALSTVFGIELVASGAGVVAGSIMIASGVLAIANFAFKEAEVWDWVAEKMAREDEDLRRQLTHILPAAVGVASAVLSLMGTGGAMIWSQISLVEQLFTIGQTATSFMYGATSIGNGIAQGRQKWTEADLIQLQGAIELVKLASEKQMTQMEQFISNQTQIQELVQEICESTRNSNLTIMQTI